MDLLFDNDTFIFYHRYVSPYYSLHLFHNRKENISIKTYKTKWDYQYRILFYVVMKIKYFGDTYSDRGDRVQILRTEF